MPSVVYTLSLHDALPIFILGSATKAIGVRSLLDIVIDSFPSPADRAPVEGTDPRTKETVTRAASAKEPFSALVFKTLTDPHVRSEERRVGKEGRSRWARC